MRNFSRGKTLQFDKPHTTYEQSIITAAQEQKEIGWYQMLGGYLSCTWEKAYTQYYKQHNMSQPVGSGKWAADMITHLWRYSHQIWLARNNELHSTSYGKISNRLELERQTHEHYKYSKPLIPKHDQFLFRIEKYERLKWTDKDLLQWIMDVKLAIKQGEPWYKKENKKQMKITRYYSIS